MEGESPSESASVYDDDPSIPDDAVLVRAVHPGHVEWEPTRRLTSQAFQDYPERRLPDGIPAVAMSVALLADLDAHGKPIEAALEKFSPDYGLATFTAGQARKCQQGVVRWAHEDRPWHAMVFSLDGRKRSNDGTPFGGPPAMRVVHG